MLYKKTVLSGNIEIHIEGGEIDKLSVPVVTRILDDTTVPPTLLAEIPSSFNLLAELTDTENNTLLKMLKRIISPIEI